MHIKAANAFLPVDARLAPFCQTDHSLLFYPFSFSPPAPILKNGVAWSLRLMAATARWGLKTHTRPIRPLYILYASDTHTHTHTLLELQKVSWNFPLSGQCCRKLWGVGPPLRPSAVILQGWHLSVGSRVSHRGTVFCRRILTDVSQRFVYAAVRQVLFSSGDQCLSCSLADLMFICWWSITLLTAWGLVLPSPLHRACVFITKDKW